MSRGISDCIGILKWRKGKPKYLKKGSCKQWDCKRSSMAGKPFHLIRNVSGISNQKFCLNGKCPWCQVWELPQKASSSRLVQNGNDKTGVGDHLIRQTEHVLLVFFLTLVNVIHYHDPKQVKLKFGTKTYTPAGILPAFLTFYQLSFRVDFPLLSATPLDTSLNLN